MDLVKLLSQTMTKYSGDSFDVNDYLSYRQIGNRLSFNSAVSLSIFPLLNFRILNSSLNPQRLDYSIQMKLFVFPEPNVSRVSFKKY